MTIILDPSAMTDEGLLDYVEALSGVIRTSTASRDEALVARLAAYEEARRRTPPIQHKALAQRAQVSTSAIINALKDKAARDARS